MNVSSIITEKKGVASSIKKELGLLQKHKPLGLIKVTDPEVIKNLLPGLSVLWAGFVVYCENLELENFAKNVVVTNELHDNMLVGFDFIVGDKNIEKIDEYSSRGIAPILESSTHLSCILKEFNPIKNEGNTFFYQENNSWSIFHSIVRYLENYKFPFDNKNLIKNILEI